MRPLRILIVAPEFPPSIGGMASHAARTAELLEQRGHSVRVVTRRGPASAESPAVRRVLTGRYGPDARRIRSAVRAMRAEVVLLANAGFAVLAPYLGVPVVARTVGNDVYAAWIGPRMPLRFLYWRLPHGPGSFGDRLRRTDQQRRVAAVLRGLRHCGAIICNSAYTEKRLQELGVQAELLHVVPGGVDPQHFSPDGPAACHQIGPPGAERSLLIGAAGGLTRVKGFAAAIEAVARLQSRWPGLALVLAGEGPLRSELERQAAELGVPDRLFCIGAVSFGEMPAFYRSLAVYLQPSVPIEHPHSRVLQEESMGRAVCEAQACALPVVASRCGGLPELISDRVTGRLVSPGDAVALSEAIEQLLCHPEQARAMGAAARRAVIERFSWDAVISATESLLVRAAESAERSAVQRKLTPSFAH